MTLAPPWERLPVVGGPLRATRVQLTGLTVAAATRLVELVLDQLDLTELVRRRVDVDALIRDVDIDAIIARIDLVGLAGEVIDGVDLPSIIRESTGTVTAEMMSDVRTQTERADDAVSGFFDRVLGRDEAR